MYFLNGKLYLLVERPWISHIRSRISFVKMLAAFNKLWAIFSELKSFLLYFVVSQPCISQLICRISGLAENQAFKVRTKLVKPDWMFFLLFFYICSVNMIYDIQVYGLWYGVYIPCYGWHFSHFLSYNFFVINFLQFADQLVVLPYLVIIFFNLEHLRLYTTETKHSYILHKNLFILYSSQISKQFF